MSSGKIFNGQTSERSKQKHCNTSIKRRDITDEESLCLYINISLKFNTVSI